MRIIIVTGVCPGIGKSTVACGLASAFTANAKHTAVFREEDILEHPAFSAVATRFRQTGGGRPEELLAASAAYLASCMDCGAEVQVIDSLFPFVTSLLAWGYSATVIQDFVGQLWQLLAPLKTSTIYIDGDPSEALARAQRTRGRSWTNAFLARMARWKLAQPVVDETSAAAHFRHERELVFQLFDATNWPVEVIDGSKGSESAVLEAAFLALARIEAQ